ncbi:MAG TPA: hypothetical protein VIK73_06580 [Limnochordales bacterium]
MRRTLALVLLVLGLLWTTVPVVASTGRAGEYVAEIGRIVTTSGPGGIPIWPR